MKVVVDENVVYGAEAFGGIGEVQMLPGRAITRECLADCEVLIVRSVTRVNQALLSGTPVRFVGTTTIGTDHIDTEYLQRQGIGFSSAPGSNADGAAQYVITALLYWARQTGQDLNGRVLGIIGVGNIGSRVHRYAQSLGMECVLNDPPRKEATGDSSFVSLSETIGAADILTIHVPLTENGPYATRKLASDEFFSRSRDGLLFVNASRGEVLDEAALRRSRSKLGGVVLDVWQNEPDISMETLECVTIGTPHVAGYSLDGRVRATEMIYEKACEFLGIAGGWTGAPPIPREKISLQETRSDEVTEAVLSAYPIHHDFGMLKGIRERPGTERGGYFDMLRKTYPFRKEFSNFEVEVKDDRAAQVLRNLDFAIS